jgi:glycosyltransferase involved in cell wall biosynthesis
VTRSLDGAAGAVVILSPNPVHDTGGGQRSAQLAREFLARDFAVLFVSHGEVTETVNLKLSFAHPRLVEHSLTAVKARRGADDVRAFLRHPGAVVVTQIPVSEWKPVLSLAQRLGAVRVYDLIDEWNSELGYGWYSRRVERRVLAQSDVLVATAPSLQRYLAQWTKRPVSLLPNAYNSGVFSDAQERARPADLPPGPVAMYVGSLWGGWMDWALIDAAARSLPDVQFVFIGDHRGEGAGLPGNCRFLGLKPQADLPRYLQHASVALLPWKNDKVTQATSPLKVYEYVAMGLRVVAPPLEPLSGIPGVVPCADQHSYEQAIRVAVGTDRSPETRTQMKEFAAGHSWRRRVDDLMLLVEAARRTPRTFTPLSWLRDLMPW